MLVYHKDPLGYAEIENKRVYGKKFAYGIMPPTEISFSAYKDNSDMLESVAYTAKFLEKKFGNKFPDVEFHHIWGLMTLDWNSIIKIAIAMGINYNRPLSVTKEDKLGLCQSIIRILEK